MAATWVGSLICRGDVPGREGGDVGADRRGGAGHPVGPPEGRWIEVASGNVGDGHKARAAA